MAIWRRLRFLPFPVNTRPNTPSPLKLAQNVGALGLEFGRTGATKDAVAAVVVTVNVVVTGWLPPTSEVGLKVQETFAGNVPQLNVTVPL
jgi:phage/plasmid-associated DNA primase